jgi:hypothetical protein
MPKTKVDHFGVQRLQRVVWRPLYLLGRCASLCIPVNKSNTQTVRFMLNLGQFLDIFFV